MEKTAMQVEKNVSASFGYVKKDMLMLNDAFSDLHEKVQELSLNYSMLLEKVEKLQAKSVPLVKKNIVIKRIPVRKKVVKKKK